MAKSNNGQNGNDWAAFGADLSSKGTFSFQFAKGETVFFPVIMEGQHPVAAMPQVKNFWHGKETSPHYALYGFVVDGNVDNLPNADDLTFIISRKQVCAEIALKFAGGQFVAQGKPTIIKKDGTVEQGTGFVVSRTGNGKDTKYHVQAWEKDDYKIPAKIDVPEDVADVAAKISEQRASRNAEWLQANAPKEAETEFSGFA